VGKLDIFFNRWNISMGHIFTGKGSNIVQIGQEDFTHSVQMNSGILERMPKHLFLSRCVLIKLNHMQGAVIKM